MSDRLQFLGTVLGALAAVWVGIRWVLGPAVTREIRVAIADEIQRIADLETRRDQDGTAIRQQSAELGRLHQRLVLVEERVGNTDRMQAILERLERRQEADSETLTDLATKIGNVEGQITAMRDRDRRHA